MPATSDQGQNYHLHHNTKHYQTVSNDFFTSSIAVDLCLVTIFLYSLQVRQLPKSECLELLDKDILQAGYTSYHLANRCQSN